MVKNHIKRISAPKRWNILRKESKFISRPNPGRDLKMSISLNTALKEMIGKTKTTKESKYLIRNKPVLVNGRKRWDEKFPVGFMDVLSLPEISEHYRMLVDHGGRLTLNKVSDSESELKISKVATKKNVPGGMVQVNCTDGRNFLFKKGEDKSIAANDTLVYSLKDQKVKDVLKMQKGALVYLYKGKHTGLIVKVEDFIGSNVVFKHGNDVFETKRQYAFVVGKDSKPVIEIKFER